MSRIFCVPRGQRSVFAARLGITPEHLSLIISGKKRPSLDLAIRISAATVGLVSLEELCPLEGGEPYPLTARLRASDPVPDLVEVRRRAARMLAEENGQLHEEGAA